MHQSLKNLNNNGKKKAMAHRFPLPTDAELESLVTQAFESMPQADQVKLSFIENQLLQKARRNKRQKNLNKIPWWIVFILAGSFATAAWWTGEQIFDRRSTDIKVNKLQSDDKIINQYQDMNKQGSKPKQNDEKKDYENKESQIIYQREEF